MLLINRAKPYPSAMTAALDCIRVATIDDKNSLEALQMRASLMWEEDREQLLANPQAVTIPAEQFERKSILVAEVAGEIVGFTALADREDGQAELDGLFVEPAKWRQGIASQLMIETEALAVARGSSEIHVIANSRAQGFYEHCGFVVIGRTEQTWRPADLMCKVLNR
jgi:N-acetylglutamate synthase-like GNAT family acetyltransferase